MEPYFLTEEDIMNFGLQGAMVGEQATDADLKAMGMEAPAATPQGLTPTQQAYNAARAQGVEPESAPQSGGIPVAAAPMSSPAMGAGTAGGMTGMLDFLSTPIPQDPFENLSRSQRTMIGFAALKDAGMALQGKEGGAVRGVMDDISNRADMERKRQAALQRQQMMGALIGGGGGSREALLAAAAQGLIDGPTLNAMLGEIDRKKGVQQEIAGKEMMIGQIDALLFDPALENALGIEGFLRTPLAELGLDQETARVKARIDQIKGGAFLQAFESLKGGGQITELEGKKAEAAQSRLNTAQNADDFREALTEYKFYIEQGVRRLNGESIPADTIYGGGQQGGAADPLNIR